MRHTFLVVPAGSAIEPETALALVSTGTKQTAADRVTLFQSGARSLLARNFNFAWCAALNRRQELGLTHFAMLHSDIAPQEGWLKILLDELERTEADIMAAVVPIKDQDGRTSTALANLETRDCETISIAELQALPATFDRGAFPNDQILLANTGCWVCDLRKPWCEQCWFEIQDKIVRDESGKLIPWTFPEDWGFSLQAHQLGAKICCTQLLTLDHYGRQAWRLPAKKS